jgi:PAS domain S-box-containing protein
MKKPLKILIVEDNPSDAKLIQLELRKTNKEFESRIVQNEKNFLNELETFQPDLILSDYSMPQFTGLDALEIAKKKCPEIPFIIVTGTVNEETAIKCMRWGAWDYVLKDRLVHLGHAVRNAIKLKAENEKKKLAEEALKKSEEQFRLITENTTDNIALVTFDLKAKYVYVSPSIKSVFGYDPEDLLGKTFFDFIHPDDKKALFPLLKKYVNMKIKKLLTGKESNVSETIEFRFKDKTGNWHFMQSTVNIVGKQLLSVARDITEKKKAEEALKESEENFKDMSENSPDGVIIADENGKIIYVNPQVEKITGYSSEELLHMTGWDMTRPEDIPIYKERMKKRLKGESHLKQYKRILVRKDGSEVYTVFSTTTTKWEGKIRPLAIVRDITERMKAEDALRESQERFQDIVTNTGDWIWETDDKGRYIYSSPVSKQVIGYVPEEVLGKHFYDFFHPDERDELKKAALKVFKKKEKFRDLINRNVHKDGHVVILETSGVPMLDDKGYLLGYRGVDRDISERKQSEEELKKNEQFLNSILESVQDGVSVLNPDMTIRHVNGIMNNWYKENLPLEGKKCYKVYHNADKPCNPCPTLRCLESGKTEWNVVPGLPGSPVEWIELYSYPIKDPNSDKVTGVVEFVRDITERKRAEKIQKTLFNISNALNTTDNMQELYSKIREFLGDVIDTTNFYVALYDEKTDMISLPFDVDEKDEFETFPAGKTLTAYVIKTEKSFLIDDKLLDRLIKEGQVETIGTPSKIWLGVPLKINNKLIGVIAVQSYEDPHLYTEKDLEILSFVSDEIALAIKHKQAEEQIRRDLEEKDILLQEIHHRVKNNMQIISSLLKLQSAHIKDKRALELFQNSRDRVKTMALIHDALYRSKDLAHIDFVEYVRKLTTQIFISYGANSNFIKIKIDIKDVFLDISTAIPCGLIINELVSNSLKYAFPEGRKGEINISFTYKGKVNTLCVKDNGIGFPGEIDLEDSPTLGLLLVNSLTKQLNGTLKLEKVKGTSFTITFKKTELKTYGKVQS